MSNGLLPPGSHTDPECPICRQVLILTATWYINGTAFCIGCANSTEGPVVDRVLQTQQDQKMTGYWTMNRGLHYFVPPSHAPKGIAAHWIRECWHDGTPKNIPPFAEH